MKSCATCIHYNVCKYREQEICQGIKIEDLIHDCKDYMEVPDNLTNISLIHVMFDYQKYLNDGVRESCKTNLHSDIENDAEIQRIMMHLMDYIRSHYYMGNFAKA